MADVRKRHKWVCRTVRDGIITIYGRRYAPNEKYRAYDGRLDGSRFLFGLYPTNPRLVTLWGTEEQHRAVAREDKDWDTLPSPYEVDGKIPWHFWHEVSDG